MAVIMSLKNDKKKKQRGRKENLYSEDSEDENIDLQKKKRKEIPKVDNFSEILQQEGRIIQELRKQYKCDQHDACFVDNGRHIKLTAMHLQCWTKEIIRGTTDNTQMPNLPIFSQSNSVKTFTSTTPSTTSMPIASNSNFNTPFFFAISPQMFSFMQNPTTNNSPNSPSNVLSYPRQSVPSLDEFFIKLDESLDGNEEFTTKFKDIFKEERISVSQICDLTDIEFD
ncbi:unnamed protein product [Rhizophagus irregularis]|nr:unnamed protein product [Rhizophagus irregularis]